MKIGILACTCNGIVLCDVPCLQPPPSRPVHGILRSDCGLQNQSVNVSLLRHVTCHHCACQLRQLFLHVRLIRYIIEIRIRRTIALQAMRIYVLKHLATL